jgi:hypothetical protein
VIGGQKSPLLRPIRREVIPHCISFPESGIMVEDRRPLGLIYWAWFLMKFLEKIKSRFLNFHAISIFPISFKFLTIMCFLASFFFFLINFTI